MTAPRTHTAPRRVVVSVALAWALATPSWADQTLSGTHIQIGYSNQGTWNSTATSHGLEVRDATTGAFTEMSFFGDPYQSVIVEYETPSASAFYALYTSTTFTAISGFDLSSGSTNSSSYVYTAGVLSIRKTEVWADSSKVVYIGFEVTNTSASAVTNVRLAHGVDPDPAGVFPTTNSVTGTGFGWVQAVGSGATIGYGNCLASDAVGTTASFSTDADTTIDAPVNVSADVALRWRHTFASIAAGQTASADFLLAFGADATAASGNYTGSSGTACETCDDDEDGRFNATCGGALDCNDGSNTIYSGAAETVADSTDQDCDTVDTCYEDTDNDGFGTSTQVDGPDLTCAGDNTDNVAEVSGDNCPAVANSGQQNFDGDSLGDACDSDDDDDGLGDTPDVCDTSRLVFTSNATQDYDGDGCEDSQSEDTDDDGDGVSDANDDCAGNSVNGYAKNWTSNGTTDFDGDGCKDDQPEDTDDDDDGESDNDDACDTSRPAFTSDGTTDYDDDGCEDSETEDGDDDNDGVADTPDPDEKNEFVCGNSDGDVCDDCTNQVDGKGPLSDSQPGNDGPDTDDDDVCNATDPDDDDDGEIDADDACDTSDLDFTSNATFDYDDDGCEDDDDEDGDDDNDGVADGPDPFEKNELLCGNADGDVCDDCTNQVDGTGPQPDNDVSDDGPDYDADDDCDTSDEDDDDDTIDDVDDLCEQGALGWTSEPGNDNDGDGCIDTGGDEEDFDDDNDGVTEAAGDTHPLDPDQCRDLDGDTCDDCAVGTDDFGPLDDFDSDDDGPDNDLDGECDAGDFDQDNDGVSNGVDACANGVAGWTSNATTDVDHDGCRDAGEDDDDDNDLDLDVADNCPVVPNADQANLDGDGAGDLCDGCTDPDTDGFGTPPLALGTCPGSTTVADNCPTAANADQLDTDLDLAGNTCDADDDDDGHADTDENTLTMDPLDVDSDGDTIADWDELTTVAAPDDTDGDLDIDALDDDSDNDGVLDLDEAGDADVDTPPADTDGDLVADYRDTDSEGDGVLDIDDNCRIVANPDQIDTDDDLQGDECDGDDDADEVPDETDNCDLVANAGQDDFNSDGEGDSCEPYEEYFRGGCAFSTAPIAASGPWLLLPALALLRRRRAAPAAR